MLSDRRAAARVLERRARSFSTVADSPVSADSSTARLMACEQAAVGGDAVARAQADDVARHQLARRHDGLHAVAQRSRRRRRHLAQRRQRPLGPVLLGESQQHGEEHDDGDDHGLERVAQEARDDGGGEQDQDERVLELGRRRCARPRWCPSAWSSLGPHSLGAAGPPGWSARPRGCRAIEHGLDRCRVPGGAIRAPAAVGERQADRRRRCEGRGSRWPPWLPVRMRTTGIATCTSAVQRRWRRGRCARRWRRRRRNRA